MNTPPKIACNASPFPLPTWIESWLQKTGTGLVEAQPGHAGFMSMVIELSRLNYQQGPTQEQGGPFAAAIVHSPTRTLISIGVNRVVPLGTSIAHAEMIAITRAQQALGQFSLRSEKDAERPYTLYTSAQMCAMCLGAVCWSGVGEVVFGAQAIDTERLTGFDEGPIHPQWREELESRDIKVTGPISSDKANAALKEYKNQNKQIYAG